MAEIPLELLRDLKHLDLADLQGRVIPFHALHDGQKWHLWFPGNDRLHHTNAVVPVECCYFAAKPVGRADVHFRLLEFLHQRAYWQDVARFADGLYADLLNAGASLSKLHLIHAHRGDTAAEFGRMVVTEIEYLFLTCRSIFDLLQEIMVALWSRVQLANLAVKKANLPSSYRKMVLREEKPMTQEEIAGRFALPDSIAGIYADSAKFFMWLRSYRDLIAHSGRTPDRVFVTERGFAISKADRPFRDMDIWCDANSLPNELGSVLSVVAHVLSTTFGTCDAFADALVKSIRFPAPVAPNHRIFVCGPHLQNLVSINQLVRDLPWYDTSAPTPGSEPPS